MLAIADQTGTDHAPPVVLPLTPVSVNMEPAVNSRTMITTGCTTEWLLPGGSAPVILQLSATASETSCATLAYSMDVGRIERFRRPIVPTNSEIETFFHTTGERECQELVVDKNISEVVMLAAVAASFLCIFSLTFSSGPAWVRRAVLAFLILLALVCAVSSFFTVLDVVYRGSLLCCVTKCPYEVERTKYFLFLLSVYVPLSLTVRPRGTPSQTPISLKIVSPSAQWGLFLSSARIFGILLQQIYTENGCLSAAGTLIAYPTKSSFCVGKKCLQCFTCGLFSCCFCATKFTMLVLTGGISSLQPTYTAPHSTSCSATVSHPPRITCLDSNTATEIVFGARWILCLLAHFVAWFVQLHSDETAFLLFLYLVCLHVHSFTSRPEYGIVYGNEEVEEY